MRDHRPDSTSPPYGRYSDPERENRLVAAMEEYRAAVEAGEATDQQAFVKRFPDIADELADCLAGMEMIQGLAKQVQPVADGESMANEPSTPTLRSLGDYRIHQEIGRGGMGVVYEAEQISLGRRVALKVLPFAALLNQRQLGRFNTEANAAARLQHSNIVPVYTLGCERGIHFYAMQLIDGPSLAEVIAELRHDSRRDENADVDDHPADTDTVADVAANILTRDPDSDDHYRAVARIGHEAAEALHYAHENGVLHRDIKPSNLLLDNSGHVWIADFGLARVEGEGQLTRTGDILGTLRYMSPEQATGERDKIDARSDVYGLGATLYELVTLTPPFDISDRREMIKQVVAGHVTAPHKVDSRIPRQLSLVISKAMSQSAADRYQSAGEMAEDLQRFLNEEAITARGPSLLRRARTWSHRHRVAATAIIGLLVVALLVIPVTHHLNQRIPDDSQTKGQDMRVSNTAKVAAAVAALAIVASGVNAKKPPKPPKSPPIQYELTLMENFEASATRVRRVNNHGEAIGSNGDYTVGFGGFYYSEAVGQISLPDLVQAPAGWAIRYPMDINDSRLIVGVMQHLDSLREAAFVIDFDSLSISPLDEPKAGNYRAHSINDSGDIAGIDENGDPIVWLWDDENRVHEMVALELPPVKCGVLNTFNNDGQIIGLYNCLYTLGVGWELLDTNSARSINDFGEVAEWKAGRRSAYASVYDSSTGVYENVFDNRKVNDFATAINNECDVAVYSAVYSAELYLVHKQDGTFDINDLIIGDPADVAYFLSRENEISGMSVRNGTNYPFLCGHAHRDDANGEARGFLLTPVLPEPN